MSYIFRKRREGTVNLQQRKVRDGRPFNLVGARTKMETWNIGWFSLQEG